MGEDLGVYNIWDIRREAEKRLPKGIFEYIDRGAEDEIALQNNRKAFDQLKFVNRVLVDVSKRNLNCEFLGKKISMPFGVSPTGTVGLTRYGGEVAVAKAASRMGIPCCVSTNAQTKMEEIWEKAGGNLWFQLYMWPDIDMRMKFIERIKAVGFDTLVITVDGPVGSNREYNKRNGYGIPLRPNPRMIAQFLAKPSWLFSVIIQHYIRRGPLIFENYPPELRSRLTYRKHKYKLAKTYNQIWSDIRIIG
jgi:isopentenyl diphosphate isomerase/L-lactate dehydrogenase-like FMN-dependent dehydrogenase